MVGCLRVEGTASVIRLAILFALMACGAVAAPTAFTWDAPATNTDGSAITASLTYELAINGSVVATTATVEASAQLVSGTNVVTVRAVTGGRKSEWSEPLVTNNVTTAVKLGRARVK